MAPNLKHFSQLTAPLAGPKVVRVKQAVSYQPRSTATAPSVDSASYWEWPTEVEPAQLVSTEHIQANLVKASAEYPAEQQQGKSALDASNDDYWAEEVVQDVPEQDEEPVSQQEQEAVDPNDYWAEASHKTNGSDDYWNTSAKVVEEIAAAVPPFATTTVRNPSINPSESAAYWQEETHNCQITTNDAYWLESRPVESADGDYWAWDVQTARTAQSDAYWTWNSMPMSSPSKLAALVPAY